MKNEAKLYYLYWKDAVKILEDGRELPKQEIDFRNEAIDFKSASLFNRNNILVPEELITYNDDEIDFSDDADVTNTTSRNWLKTSELKLDQEIIDWMETNEIDPQELATQLIRNFYSTLKGVRDSATL